MKLNGHGGGIVDYKTWKEIKPPKKGDAQWKDGRSAKELAKYVTKDLPNMPKEMEELLMNFVDADSIFDWDAEFVTKLPGKGEGRNHDAFFVNDDIVVCVEAKADETLGNYIKEEMKNASVNKLERIVSLLKTLYPNGYDKYADIRYQLLTASVGTIIEAQNRGVKKAVLLVIVFESAGGTTKEKLENNEKDINHFLKSTNAIENDTFWKIPNNTDVDLYFSKIIIRL